MTEFPISAIFTDNTKKSSNKNIGAVNVRFNISQLVFSVLKSDLETR